MLEKSKETVGFRNKETEVAHYMFEKIKELSSGNSMVESIGTMLYMIKDEIGSDYVINELISDLKERGYVS